jgi:hypothetical protein
MSIDNTKVVDLNIKKENKLLDFSDFQKQNIKFDISKLQEAYNQIVQTKKFDDGGGVTHFGAISLTQIPGDPDSIKEIKPEAFIGLSLINQEKKFQEILKLMSLLIQNLLKIMKTLILKKFMMYFFKI